MPDLPSGTVTFLFADVEGSTRLMQELGDGYGPLLGELRRLLRAAMTDAGGHEVDCRADELFVVFQRAVDGLRAAVSAQRLLAARAWPQGAVVRVRMGLHTGEPTLEGDAYLGIDVSRAARICAAAHGGQILLSQTTRELVAGTAEVRDLGAYSLAGLAAPERIYQVVAADLRTDFPPLRVTGTRGRRLRAIPSLSLRRPTLEEAGWQVRSLLPTVAEPLQKPLAELGAALFTGHRAATDADRFLGEVDRKRLARRLTEQRELAVLSRRARGEADSLTAQIAGIERIAECRRTLADVARTLSGAHELPRTEAQIVALRERVASTTAELDETLNRAARTLDPLGHRLRRTRRRGVYHSRERYVVPYVDENGGDRWLEFETLAQANDFKRARRLTTKAQTEYIHGSALHKGGEYGPGSGGGAG